MTIVSIQSHVAFGYVGNRAATFPLQRLGFDVAVVNTVQFSNHTGYGSWKGQIFTAEHIKDILEGLKSRDVFKHTDALLTGYMGDASIGQAIQHALGLIRNQSPQALYCCDPVMGDTGREIFVREDIPDFFKKVLVPLADIITPNQFEAELLTGQPIKTYADAKQAVQMLHQSGPRYVVLTSLLCQECPQGFVEVMLSVKDQGSWKIQTPLLPLNPAPNGAGDLVSALFLAEMLKTGDPVLALEHGINAIFDVFEETLKSGQRELQIIQAQDNLIRPEACFKPVKMH